MRNLFDITGRVALVTGGSRGIGEMIATGYVANGAKVYISSRNKSACAEVAAKLSRQGTCIALPFDLGTMEGVAGLARELAAREGRLDILVNNAGATWGAPIEEFPESGWDKVMDINLKGVFFLTQKVLPLVRAAATAEHPARVINVASVDGMTPPAWESYPYSASKAGCIMLTRHLARRLAPEHILVNAISPGPFDTKMLAFALAERGEQIRAANPLGRIGNAEDVAGVAIFLASRASAYTTGAVIPCDGGFAEV